MPRFGSIASGHPETTKAAEIILQEGGNAFDAALAAMCAACVAEPVLASMGGGGFLMAQRSDAPTQPVLYDFFVQTPKRCRDGDEVDFYPIMADFGTTQQEFHMGMGAIATPGMVRGLFDIHRDLGRMPLHEIVAPAVVLAKQGVALNRLQAYIFEIVKAIYIATPQCRAVYGQPDDPTAPLREGDLLKLPNFDDALESLAREGEDLFYKGEIGQRLVADCRTSGGHLRADDLRDYMVRRRQPLSIDFADGRVFTNPPPSTGGILIAFGLELLKDEAAKLGAFGSVDHSTVMARTMAQTNKARIEAALHDQDHDGAISMLAPEFVAQYKAAVLGRPQALRGTTHISVIDRAGNAASMTLSNGEGAGYMVDGTGIMMNNMLGEEDINPHGFHNWPTDMRMCSMMSPSVIAETGGVITALGSGGSNRIRSAVLQVIVNLLNHRMPLAQAVESPRLHVEGDRLSIEPGLRDDVVAALVREFPNFETWDQLNLFFGGVHGVRFNPADKGFDGFGDPRRGGAASIV